MTEFTDDELLAYADERLNSDRGALIESSLRAEDSLRHRLTTLLSERDQGAHTIGEIWRRLRLSCPPRAVWAALIENRLGDGLSRYLQFHVKTVGCPICLANLRDLERPDQADSRDRRAKKIFQSSAGQLRPH